MQVEPDKKGHPNLLEWFAQECQKRERLQWGPGLPHRLDRPTSGLVVISKRKKAHSLLQAQWENRTVEKHYIAEVEGIITQGKQQLDHYLFKDLLRYRAEISDVAKENYKNCSLQFEVITLKEKNSLIKIKLLTGRYHQIRAQLAHIGHPIVGDLFYGASSSIGEAQIKLHAYRLVLVSPTDGQKAIYENFPKWLDPLSFPLQNQSTESGQL